MKKIYGFAALCAAMTLASCSSDNEPAPVVNPDGTTTTYLAVSLANPEDTRADNNARTDLDESGATSGILIIFDADGNKIGDEAIEFTTGNWKDSDEANVDKTETVIAISASELAKPASLVMVLNADANVKADLEACNTPADVAQKMNNYLDELDTTDGNPIKTAEKYAKAGTFLMSNAVWKNGNNIVYAQPIAGTYLTPEDARTNPTKVYVERIAARVDVTKSGSFTNSGATVHMGQELTGDGKKLTIEIKGVEVANLANQSSLIKKIDNNASYWSGWNGTNQSHWADYLAPDRYNNKSFSEITTSLSTTKNYFYAQENVYSPASGEAADKNLTCVLVTAQLKDGNDPAKLVRLMNNKLYYTEDDGAKTLVGYLATTYYTKDASGKYVSLDYDSNKAKFEWKSAATNGYEGYLQINATKWGDTQIYTPDDDAEDGFSAVAVSDVNDTLKGNKYLVWRWNNGYCYYYAPIKAAKDATGTDVNIPAGVVRNHIYDITLNGVAGLGVPVFDPNEKIVPVTPPNDSPDTKWYLATTINILKWTRYSQGMNFTQGNNEYKQTN